MFSINIEKTPKWFLNFFLFTIIIFLILLIILSAKIFFLSSEKVIVFGKEFGVTNIVESDNFSLERIPRKGISHSDCISLVKNLINESGFPHKRSGKGFFIKKEEYSIYFYCPNDTDDNQITLLVSSSDKEKNNSISTEFVDKIKEKLPSITTFKSKHPNYRWISRIMPRGMSKDDCFKESRNIFDGSGINIDEQRYFKYERSDKIIEDHVITKGNNMGKVYLAICHDDLFFINIFSNNVISDSDVNDVSLSIKSIALKESNKFDDLFMSSGNVFTNFKDKDECREKLSEYFHSNKIEYKISDYKWGFNLNEKDYLINVSCRESPDKSIFLSTSFSSYFSYSYYEDGKKIIDYLKKFIKNYNEKNPRQVNELVMLTTSVINIDGNIKLNCIEFFNKKYNKEKYFQQNGTGGIFFVKDGVSVAATCIGSTVYLSVASKNDEKAKKLRADINSKITGAE